MGDFQALMETINRILGTFYPYQCNKSLAGIFEKGGTKQNIRTDTNNFEYMLEIRRILAKAAQQFPQVRFTVHIYKMRAEGSDSSRFTDSMYHSLQIDLGATPGNQESKKEEATKEDEEAQAPPPSPKANSDEPKVDKNGCELMDM